MNEIKEKRKWNREKGIWRLVRLYWICLRELALSYVKYNVIEVTFITGNAHRMEMRIKEGNGTQRGVCWKYIESCWLKLMRSSSFAKHFCKCEHKRCAGPAENHQEIFNICMYVKSVRPILNWSSVWRKSLLKWMNEWMRGSRIAWRNERVQSSLPAEGIEQHLENASHATRHQPTPTLSNFLIFLLRHFTIPSDLNSKLKICIHVAYRKSGQKFYFGVFIINFKECIFTRSTSQKNAKIAILSFARWLSFYKPFSSRMGWEVPMMFCLRYVYVHL